MGWLYLYIYRGFFFLRGERAVTVFISCLPDMWYVKNYMYEYRYLQHISFLLQA